MGDLRPGVFWICGKYRLRTKVGSGSFGDVYYANNVISGEAVAIKMESLKMDHPTLDHEWSIYKALGPNVGIPRILWFGCERSYKALVMDFLGPSLEELFNKCNCRFSLKTVLMLADILISRIEYIHEHNYIHRDIKPNNFLVDFRHESHISLIDFGLASKYCDGAMLLHIPYQTGNTLTGTARYASINAHRGIEQTRHDDLESLAYLLIYFLHGALPWQRLDTSLKKPNYRRIMQWKLGISPVELCSQLPDEFQVFLEYACNLSFSAQPNYLYLRKLFQDRFQAEGYHEHEECVFDWEGSGVDVGSLAVHPAHSFATSTTSEECW